MRATITTALENGAELEDMQKVAGHRDLGATNLHDGRGSIDPRKRAAMQACIDHARALLDSARAVQHTNIAYHPATLTLEETLPDVRIRNCRQYQSRSQRRRDNKSRVRYVLSSEIPEILTGAPFTFKLTVRICNNNTHSSRAPVK